MGVGEGEEVERRRKEKVEVATSQLPTRTWETTAERRGID